MGVRWKLILENHKRYNEFEAIRPGKKPVKFSDTNITAPASIEPTGAFGFLKL